KKLVKIFVAAIAASMLFVACSSQSPVSKLTDFANTLEQTYQNFTSTDWSNAIASFATIQDALSGYKFKEGEAETVKDAETKVLDIFAQAEGLDEAAQAKLAGVMESSKSLLELLIPSEALEVELDEDENVEPLDLEAIANEIAAEAETASKELPKTDAVPFQLVEEKPQFNGGDANNFAKWVNKNINYPETAKEEGIQGRVVLQFDVNAEGNVENVVVLRGVDPALDAEAVRVVSASPAWTPGKQAGNATKVSYTFPVVFALR
ncbi:MAG: energy transducer TonB, partial [Bacteroidales bacterium]|nr:energy transducer TonB [Bacteroidales bacterium]